MVSPVTIKRRCDNTSNVFGAQHMLVWTVQLDKCEEFEVHE